MEAPPSVDNGLGTHMMKIKCTSIGLCNGSERGKEDDESTRLGLFFQRRGPSCKTGKADHDAFHSGRTSG